MSYDETAHVVEILDEIPQAQLLPGAQLQVGDLVFGPAGRLHPLVTAGSGGGASAWIQRGDLSYREHLRGEIAVVLPSRDGRGVTR